jgi:hypothetical protein
MENEAKIARAFSIILRAEIGGDVDEVVTLNATPAYACACASHDFCDANVYMGAAWEIVMGRSPDVASEADADIWGRAWDLAKASNFSVEMK